MTPQAWFEKQVHFLALALSPCEMQPADRHGPPLSSCHTGGRFLTEELAQPGSSRRGSRACIPPPILGRVEAAP